MLSEVPDVRQVICGAEPAEPQRQAPVIGLPVEESAGLWLLWKVALIAGLAAVGAYMLLQFSASCPG